ncbi:D-amino acid aminotransferase [Elstera litoralis]|uniref:Probable branched-chain-amino-acid aminotransferase n=1 Tax=Elstera litoralis TaxID=552518 RepID=A0A0F3IWE2_9PROT|nr:D-amino-acid transaminase [Elstera litoralis]KJV10873.1 D-amino acid aminotransferase [Elstera litoralis]
MSRIVLLNGDFLDFADAKLPIMDRGFLFADGIYEVSAVLNGRTIDNEAHLARLDRSLRAIDIPNPYSTAEWVGFQNDLITRNGLREGTVYIQVTRGVAEREFTYAEGLTPTVLMVTQAKNLLTSKLAVDGATVITLPDLRWARRDIKSVGLLAQVLAKQAAKRAGADEAWMVEDGLVTEGASSSAFIVTRDGALVTRPFTQAVLPGVTRRAITALIRETDLRLDERAFSVAEALAAQEAFYTSASSFVTPVASLDGDPIGTGKPGPIAIKLREFYIRTALAG